MHIASDKVFSILTEKKDSIMVPYKSLGNEDGIIEVYRFDCMQIKCGYSRIELHDVLIGKASASLLKNVAYDIILNEACNYLNIICGFIIVQGLYLVIAATLRSYNLMKEVMFASIVMNILNIVGNAILINGFITFSPINTFNLLNENENILPTSPKRIPRQITDIIVFVPDKLTVSLITTENFSNPRL